MYGKREEAVGGVFKGLTLIFSSALKTSIIFQIPICNIQHHLLIISFSSGVFSAGDEGGRPITIMLLFSGWKIMA